MLFGRFQVLHTKIKKNSRILIDCDDVYVILWVLNPETYERFFMNVNIGDVVRVNDELWTVKDKGGQWLELQRDGETWTHSYTKSDIDEVVDRAGSMGESD